MDSDTEFTYYKDGSKYAGLDTQGLPGCAIFVNHCAIYVASLFDIDRLATVVDRELLPERSITIDYHTGSGSCYVYEDTEGKMGISWSYPRNTARYQQEREQLDKVMNGFNNRTFELNGYAWTVESYNPERVPFGNGERADTATWMKYLLTGGDSERFFNYKMYLLSSEWKRKADMAKISAGYRCQVCNSEDNGQIHLQAHHRTYARVGHELPHDITVLCARCHKYASRFVRIPKCLDRYTRPRVSPYNPEYVISVDQED